MPVTIVVDDVEPEDAERLRTFAEEALAELGADLDVPVQLADPHSRKPNVGGWASSSSGVHIVADRLENADPHLRRLVYHEVGYWWAFREYPALQPLYSHELFASWFATSRSGCAGWTSRGKADSYERGVLVGAALGGDEAARDVVGALDLIACLEDIDEPRAFVGALLDHQGVPGPTGLQRRGCEKCRRNGALPPGP